MASGSVDVAGAATGRLAPAGPLLVTTRDRLELAGTVDGRLCARSCRRREPRRLDGMCRNIRQLHNFDPPASSDEVRAAALQYVRKISGSTKPSKANEAAFERAVEAVTAASQELLAALVTTAPPKDRDVEAAKARERAAKRYAA